ncbi:MAG TPA: DUF402 domain-containing protein [Chloroflexota bacterium]|nr:DUF402 domain-containing protein [Chloroflexota bacterium]
MIDEFRPGVWVRVVHDKPWTAKRTIVMWTTSAGWSANGTLTLLRSFTAGGRYDSIGAPKLAGDHGTIEVVPGGWVLRRTYTRADGRPIAELFNVQTPAQLRRGEVRYTDLEVDVMRFPDGRVEVVDLDDLTAAERAGHIPADLAHAARDIAQRLADVLKRGGDWRTADEPYRSA